LRPFKSFMTVVVERKSVLRGTQYILHFSYLLLLKYFLLNSICKFVFPNLQESWPSLPHFVFRAWLTKGLLNCVFYFMVIYILYGTSLKWNLLIWILRILFLYIIELVCLWNKSKSLLWIFSTFKKKSWFKKILNVLC
jgi:hypothetical protein